MNDTDLGDMTPCISCGRQRWFGQAHYCDSIITNLRCWNCQISLSPTQSEYEKSDYRCPGCGKIQINKTTDNGNENLPNCPCGSDAFEFRSIKEKEFDTKIPFVYVCKKCGNIYQKVDDEFWLLKEGINKMTDNGNIKDEYDEYLASYHGSPFEPLSRKKYEEIKNHRNIKEVSPYEQYLASKDPLDEVKSSNPKDKIGRTKLPLRLIPPPALAHLSRALYDGAITKGYGPLNWRETEVNLTTYLEAALRHIYSILDGEDIDKSGCYHAAHAMACMAIVIDAKELGKLIDDRNLPGNFAHLVTQLQEKKE